MLKLLANVWEDENGSVSIEQVMGLSLGAIVLLGVLWVFRNPVMNGLTQLVEGFFKKAGDSNAAATTETVTINVNQR